MHILSGQEKKYVEKFYTQCRDILHDMIGAVKFLEQFSGSLLVESSQADNKLLEPVS